MGIRASQKLNGRGRQRLILALGLIGMTILGYCWGRSGSTSQALAAPPDPPQSANSATSSDYSSRVVATIYGNTSVSREDLGEYLIARFGADRLDLLINKLIIDKECKERGIEVTAAEIEAALTEDIASIKVDRKAFIDNVLAKYRKTLFEWKEDVIRPRLQLMKYCRDQVKVEPQDMDHAFEAHYGEKVECRIILWPNDANTRKMVQTQLYTKIRDSEEEFDRAARMQPSPTLASNGGRIQPFGHHSTGNELMERAAFCLKPGELSEVIETPQGLLVMKCDRRIPADPTVKITDEKVRATLEKEIIEKKVQLEIPNAFKKMRERADPKVFIKTTLTEEQLTHDARENLKPIPTKPEDAEKKQQ
jgi:hypothetical protein